MVGSSQDTAVLGIAFLSFHRILEKRKRKINLDTVLYLLYMCEDNRDRYLRKINDIL